MPSYVRQGKSHVPFNAQFFSRVRTSISHQKPVNTAADHLVPPYFNAAAATDKGIGAIGGAARE